MSAKIEDAEIALETKDAGGERGEGEDTTNTDNKVIKDDDKPGDDDADVADAAATTIIENRTDSNPSMVASAPNATSSGLDLGVIEKVKERLQFFFSDANLRQDKFLRMTLWNSSDTSTSYPGQVTIVTLLKFNTIKSITIDPSIIAQAATDLPDLLTVSKDGLAIGRKVPFTADMMNANIPVSLYVCNLPVNDPDPPQPESAPITKVDGNLGDTVMKEEEEKTPSKQTDDLTKDSGSATTPAPKTATTLLSPKQSYSAKARYAVTTQEVRQLFDDCPGVTMVKLRFGRARERRGGEEVVEQTESAKKTPYRSAPTGAALIEFETRDHLEQAATDLLTIRNGQKVEPKRRITIQGRTLEIMLLQDFVDQQKDGHGSGKKEKAGKQGANDNGVNKGEDDDGDYEEEDKPGSDEILLKWKQQCLCVLHLQGLSCDREAILDVVAKGLGMTVADLQAKKIVHVDYSRGQTEGAIRLRKAQEGQKEMDGDDDIKTMKQVTTLCQKLADGELEIANSKVASATILDGVAYEKYWDQVAERRQLQARNETPRKRQSSGKHFRHHRKQSKRQRSI